MDQCRIPCTKKTRFPNSPKKGRLFGPGGRQDLHPESRYPTNIILDEDAARLLDVQAAGASGFYYCARASAGEKNAGLLPGVENNHPCVKPLQLCRYLAALILPPKRDTPRRLLVPFCGTGSEIIGAVLAGWDEIVGIEIDEESIRIAEQRIRHWVSGAGRLANDRQRRDIVPDFRVPPDIHIDCSEDEYVEVD